MSKNRKHKHKVKRATPVKQAIKNIGMFKGRYSDRELSLIHVSFNSENEQMIMILQKFFLQGELSDGEMAILRSLPMETIDVLQKTILPEIDPNTSFGQATDLWVSIDTADKDPEIVYDCMMARQIVLDYFKQRFEIMRGGEESRNDVVLGELIFSGSNDKRGEVIKISARNTILNHINLHLTQLIVLADQTPETAEEAKERMAKDSAK